MQVSGILINKKDIKDFSSKYYINLKQNFVFVPIQFISLLEQSISDHTEYLQINYDRTNKSNTYFTYIVKGESLTTSELFDNSKYNDFQDKLDIYLKKLGAIKKSKNNIILDFGILKLNNQSIEMKIKLKKIKKCYV